MSRFEVVGPLAVVRLSDGSQKHVYAPAVLDSEDERFTEEELRRLEDRGVMREVDENGEAVKRDEEEAAPEQDAAQDEPRRRRAVKDGE